ncbi:ABC transporter substrate-binding protein [Halomonas sp. MCCC 1A17488]|uniref:ABC transporter substrate-binding protein n=2 Tax=Halomonadaceae TaxID=28256 RepID=A0ABX7W7W6_9GAMM|nr:MULTISPECIES: ABC transporter substrate-binding protein [Halomonas]MCE8018055.1 ABC transporter substrate-binding protein [Halomonas sp. MCCC 1A17488]MCG3241388.1 ABC transporter substrate-binding protein [Halomonas sp. MCCC 1A17488]QPP48649.1 ABC transporter substrate-binding protein [Halomonas sp. SS10-MC5]QTP55991.1 ABC transporter substrate-binding protein [Halomonas sulfidoxydans]
MSLRLLRVLPLAAMLAHPLHAASALQEWESVLDEARGQTVYWHAWAGDTRINDYLDWVKRRVRDEHEVELVHVKIDDTGSAVSRVLAERSAGNHDDGSVDLVWLNGENFAAMKENDLLYGPFAEQLPNFSLTHPEHNPEVVTDFTLPTEGYESPWGKAQITFYYDAEALDEEPPRNMAQLLAWAEINPGRFTYPRIPDFLGSTFLKQALIALADDTDVLYEPVVQSDFEAVTAPLWEYLDALHPHLWRRGRQFPANGPELRRLMGDGELSLAFTFNPAEPAAAVADFELPESTRSYVLEGGTLGNVHFVAIPFNSPRRAGAMVVANFLLSPEAQARKQDLAVWGDPTVLDVTRLDAETRSLFEQESDNPALLPPEALAETLPEPHPSWMTALQDAWQARYVGR